MSIINIIVLKKWYFIKIESLKLSLIEGGIVFNNILWYTLQVEVLNFKGVNPMKLKKK